MTQIDRVLSGSSLSQLWKRGRVLVVLKPALVRFGATYVGLAVLNLGAWYWAITVARGNPSLIAVALVIYGLGLRHAVDADHIAAIDNVTRNLMQAGQQPMLVGFWFSMGHSVVITAVAIAVVTATSMLSTFKHLQDVGGTISTCISALFLIAIAAMNISIFAGLYKSYRRLRAGGSFCEAELDLLLSRQGLSARFLRPLFRMVSKSWHMFALGLLFGLGFDTATEVAMYSASASQVARGIPFQSILVFPTLFAAGMSLVDTTDSVMMVGAYQWALAKPKRRLFYNMTITLLSIIVALGVGGIEALDLIAEKLALKGLLWEVMGRARENFNNLGFGIVGLFVVAWGLSWLIYRYSRPVPPLNHGSVAGRSAPTSCLVRRRSRLRGVRYSVRSALRCDKAPDAPQACASDAADEVAAVPQHRVSESLCQSGAPPAQRPLT